MRYIPGARIAAVLIILAACPLHGIASTGGDDDTALLVRIRHESRLLLQVISPAAQSTLKLLILERFQDRILGVQGTDGWTDEKNLKVLYGYYHEVWKAFRLPDSEMPKKLLKKHGDIRRKLRQTSSLNILEKMVKSLEASGEEFHAILSRGVKELESMSSSGDQMSPENPVVKKFFSLLTKEMAGWKADRKLDDLTRDIQLLKRLETCVSHEDFVFDRPLLSFAKKIADTCRTGKDKDRLKEYRRLNPALDLIRAGKLLQQRGLLDSEMKRRFCCAPRVVERAKLRMVFDEEGVEEDRDDEVVVNRAVLTGIQYMDPEEREWFDRVFKVPALDGAALDFYILLGLGFRLRYNLEVARNTEKAPEGMADHVWLEYPAKRKTSRDIDILLPGMAVKHRFYYLNESKKKAFWVAEQCWSKATALLKFEAYLAADWVGGPDVRSKAKESFRTLWKACGESGILDDEQLADLFRRAAYDAELKKKPFLLRYPLVDSVKEALGNLFHVDNHILKTGRGEILPDRALAKVLVEHFKQRGATSLLFIGFTGCNATGGPRVKEGPTVGICTVIPMRTVK